MLRFPNAKMIFGAGMMKAILAPRERFAPAATDLSSSSEKPIHLRALEVERVVLNALVNKCAEGADIDHIISSQAKHLSLRMASAQKQSEILLPRLRDQNDISEMLLLSPK